jgi:hypothetical protein
VKGLLLWGALGLWSALPALAVKLTPYVAYRPFPWDNQQREDGGQQ